MPTAAKKTDPPAKKAAAAKPAPKVAKDPTVELPVPPDGYRYVLMRGEHCLAQTCPMHLDDPIAYSKSPGFEVDV